MKPGELRTKLETTQAKQWGYKTIKAANEDGMNVTRNSCTISELAVELKISHRKAYSIAQDWKYRGLCKYVGFANLDQIIFI